MFKLCRKANCHSSLRQGGFSNRTAWTDRLDEYPSLEKKKRLNVLWNGQLFERQKIDLRRLKLQTKRAHTRASQERALVGTEMVHAWFQIELLSWKVASSIWWSLLRRGLHRQNTDLAHVFALVERSHIEQRNADLPNSLLPSKVAILVTFPISWQEFFAEQRSISSKVINHWSRTYGFHWRTH